MKIEKDEITIRDFTETDLPLMFKWLTDKRVLEYYEGRDVRFTMIAFGKVSGNSVKLHRMLSAITWGDRPLRDQTQKGEETC